VVVVVFFITFLLGLGELDGAGAGGVECFYTGFPAGLAKACTCSVEIARRSAMVRYFKNRI